MDETDEGTATPRLHLVTRGDDAGVVPSANAAIRDTFLDGILRNASVMAPTPALGDAADRLSDLDGLCIGMHLTLTAEWDTPRWGPVLPSTEVPSLLDGEGCFPPTVERLEETLVVEDALREADAQLQQLRDSGFDVSYLDTHMLVSRIDGLDTTLAEFCEREGLLYADRAVPAFTVEETAGSQATRVAEQLRGLEPGANALVGHPCYDTRDARTITGMGFEPGEVATDRDRQRRLFVDPDITDAIRRVGAVPIRYTEI